MKRLLFVLLILFLPSQLGIHFWPSWSLVNGVRVDYLSPTIYFTDILAVLLILVEIKNIQINKKLTTIVCIGIAFNLYFSTSLMVSLYGWIKLIEFGFIGFVIYKNRNAFARLANSVIPVTLLWTCTLAIFQWLNNGSLNGILYWLGERTFTTQTPGIALSKIVSTVSLRPYATLPHPNVLAGVIVVMCLFLFKTHKKDAVFYVVSCISLLTLVLSESYNAWIALVVCIGFIFLEKLITPRIQLTWVLFITSIFTLSLLTLFLVKAPSVDTLQSAPSRERFELLYLSGLTLSQNPLYGSGLGTFITHIPLNTGALPEVYRSRATSWLQPAHNIPVLLFSETGLVGLLCTFIALTFLPMTAPLIFILQTSLFDHYWITLQSPALLFAIIMGITYTIDKHKKKK